MRVSLSLPLIKNEYASLFSLYILPIYSFTYNPDGTGDSSVLPAPAGVDVGISITHKCALVHAHTHTHANLIQYGAYCSTNVILLQTQAKMATVFSSCYTLWM
jgi:hypothetical protein